MSRFTRAGAVVALACGVLAVSLLPAVAASGATTPAITLTVNHTGTPARPKWLYLGRGHASVSKPTQLQAGKYTFNISYRFYVGNEGYYCSTVSYLG